MSQVRYLGYILVSACCKCILGRVENDHAKAVALVVTSHMSGRLNGRILVVLPAPENGDKRPRKQGMNGG